MPPSMADRQTRKFYDDDESNKRLWTTQYFFSDRGESPWCREKEQLWLLYVASSPIKFRALPPLSLEIVGLLTQRAYFEKKKWPIGALNTNAGLSLKRFQELEGGLLTRKKTERKSSVRRKQLTRSTGGERKDFTVGLFTFKKKKWNWIASINFSQHPSHPTFMFLLNT